MTKIFAIAVNTFKEAVRDRILYTLIIFGLVLIGASVVISPITLGQEEKVMKDIGLASISIFGVLVILFVGTGLLYKELDKRTIYTIISKPIHRYQFILGKYFGLLMTLLVIVVIMTGTLYIFLWFSHAKPTFNLLNAIGLIYVKLAIVTAVAIFFSVVSSPALTAMFTFGMYFIGHLSADMKDFAAQITEPLLKNTIIFFYYIVPNLDFFDVKREVVHQITIEPSYYFFAVMYAISYISATLIIAILIFERKDFK